MIANMNVKYIVGPGTSIKYYEVLRYMSTLSEYVSILFTIIYMRMIPRGELGLYYTLYVN